jgi:hypothetical protein
MRLSWSEIYFGVGFLAIIALILWRVSRPKAFHSRTDRSIIWELFNSEWIGALLVIAVWPIVVPYLVWRHRRSRGAPQFIRDDEPWPPG